MNSLKIHSESFVFKIAKLLKVIAHPVRLQILAALKENDRLNVSEISELVRLDVEQSLLSHHLIKLRDNGVLRSSKEGLFVYYSVVDKKILNILNCMEQCELV